MTRTRARCALSLLALSLTACGGGESSNGSSFHPASGAKGGSVAKSETYTCGGDGVSSVTVKSSGDDVWVTWKGRSIQPSNDFTEYVVTLNRADGNLVHMLYQHVQNEGPTRLSIFDGSTATKKDVPGGQSSGTQHFPEALAGFDSQEWNGSAAVNVDGTDIAHCK